jgi:hypothetical protein
MSLDDLDSSSATSRLAYRHLHPMSTTKPRARLPWERELDDVTSPQYAPPDPLSDRWVVQLWFMTLALPRRII